MILNIDDWKLEVHVEDTRQHSSFYTSEHCTCGYCENFYRTIGYVAPNLGTFLADFGADVNGPVEMLPFEPTLCLVAYRVTGRILKYGLAPIMVDHVPVLPKEEDESHFKLEVGELRLPWVMCQHPDDVVSPANEPEYLEMMYRRLLERRAGEFIIGS